MDERIARLNIEHFRKLLLTETNSAKRQTILRLLADEENKLTVLKQRERGTEKPKGP